MPAQGSLGLTQLARDLNRMSPALRRRLRKTIGDLGKSMESGAKYRAAWSDRIPGAISVRTTVTTSAVGVELRVSSAGAPHARPFEGLSGGRVFRHPVFGRDVWVSQDARPYARPAQEQEAKRLPAAAEQAIEEVAREAGFR